MVATAANSQPNRKPQSGSQSNPAAQSRGKRRSLPGLTWDESVQRYRDLEGKFASKEDIERVLSQGANSASVGAAELRQILAHLKAIDKRLDQIDQKSTAIKSTTDAVRSRLAVTDDLVFLSLYAAWLGVLIVAKVLLATGLPQAADNLSKELNKLLPPGPQKIDETPLQKGDQIGQWIITSGFGPRESPGGIGSTNHQGVDVGTDQGTPLYAPVDSQIECDSASGYGGLAILTPPPQTGVKWVFRAGHLSSCTPGFYLAGQEFAKTGGRPGTNGAGTSTGEHLHWEQRDRETDQTVVPWRGFVELALGIKPPPTADTATGTGATFDAGGEVSDEVINAMFGGFSRLDAPAIIGIGLAEGTLDGAGKPTLLYTGHDDPGNGAWNKGFGSWQASPVANAAEGDKLAFARLKNQCIPDAIADAKTHGVTLTPGLLAQICDMWIQAPLAADAAIGNLKKALDSGKTGDDAWLEMRVNSYINPATGQFEVAPILRPPGALEHDQRRRMLAVKDGMAKMPAIAPKPAVKSVVLHATESAKPAGGPAQSVLRVNIGGEKGSCFVFAPGQCLTNAHVTKRGDEGTATTPYGVDYRVSVVKRGTEGPRSPDIAILKIQGGEALPVIPQGTPQPGQQIEAIGYPFGGSQTRNPGKIASVEDRVIYQGKNDPGMSGGAIISGGRWVGLNVASSSRGQEAIAPATVNQFLGGQ